MLFYIARHALGLNAYMYNFHDRDTSAVTRVMPLFVPWVEIPARSIT